MSAIASFVLIPKSVIAGLRDSTVPKKKLFGGVNDTYHDFLKKRGREVASYEWSGYVLATLLCYLQQKHQIDLMKSDEDGLSAFLTQTRGATHFVFTSTHKGDYATRLAPELFSVETLRDYHNEFNGANEPDIGKPMLDGIRAFQQSLQQSDPGSIVIFSIG